jgi:hypothetical protein
MEGFHAELIPYRKENIGTGNNRINPTFTRPEEKCYFNRDDERDPDWCPVATKFPKGYRFGMTIKFHDSLAGWFHGRLGEPKFDFKTENNLAQVSVEAAPIALPVIDTAIPVSQVPRSYLDFLIKNQIEGAWHGPLPTDFELKSGGAFGSDRKKRFLFEEYYSATYKVFNDQSTYTQSVWRFGTLGQGEISDRCKAEGFAGMVSTNALAYAFGPPEFNSVSQSLDYKLSSPHFDETGMANLGSYDLAIDTKLARCLYGFTDAPISASISVISASGEARVATTAVGQRGDLMYLSAKGFEFSAPTVRVKLTQPVSVFATPSPTPTLSAKPSPSATTLAKKPASVTVSKKSITCVKGATKKKVTATNPKCPKGFKKA